ncbi:MAG TPA: DegT/DnrJ/EryC1/StrS family aminotransferase [Candidatus Omnitrophota bacterium]|nr:DegT/DnrJ/EryC1/StrS family aminotransferase [Candidatus Omnitrophota bacterium]HRZ15555.1 DegT/DnrJ/EryC1/StrS family aminotransferase [Candidatus Omnitrophota bacterium]
MKRSVALLDLKRQYLLMKKEIDAALAAALEEQHWILGPRVGAFEKTMADYLGLPHAVGTASGTDSLVVALRALAITLKQKEYFEKEDLIITTPFTFTATGDAILRSGATPLFVDIVPETFNIDTRQVRECLASGTFKRIIGILPVHLFGQSADMDEIMELAGKYGLFVVEDVAQSLGGTWRGKQLGTIGAAGAFSFFPSKNLGGFGDGGMVATGDAHLAEVMRMLTKHGGRDKYNVDHIGYNSRLDTLQAAVLQARFAYLDDFNRKRRAVAAVYARTLSGIPGVRLPGSSAPAGHVYNQYTIRIENGKRDDVAQRLKTAGIATAVYYPVALHKMKVFQGRCSVWQELGASEKACSEVISIPVDPLLNNEEIDYVWHSFKEAVISK